MAGPNPGPSNVLNGVVALAAADVWAVGKSTTAGGTDDPLVEQWNGSTWLQVATPPSGDGNALDDIAALSPTDLWAVGTIVEHWVGSSWQVVTTPRPNAGTAELTGIVALAASDVWAVGSAGGANGPVHTLVEHWDGTAWSQVASPNPGAYDSELFGIAGPSPTDLWAVGDSDDTIGGAPRTLVEHWDGAAWTAVPSPSPGTGDLGSSLFGIAELSPTDLWAVGRADDKGHVQTLIEHGDGTSWSRVASPNLSVSPDALTSITAVSPSDVWAAGAAAAGPSNGGLSELPTPTRAARRHVVPLRGGMVHVRQRCGDGRTRRRMGHRD